MKENIGYVVAKSIEDIWDIIADADDGMTVWEILEPAQAAAVRFGEGYKVWRVTVEEAKRQSRRGRSGNAGGVTLAGAGEVQHNM